MVLASSASTTGQWCWPVVLPSCAVQVVGQLCKSIAQRVLAHVRMYFHFIIPITCPFIITITITITITIIIILIIIIIIIIIINIIIILIIITVMGILINLVIIVIIFLINIISIIIIIEVLGTCCQRSWPMVPASGTDHWCCSVLLARGQNGTGQWCWPVVLPSCAVQFAGQLGKSICGTCKLMQRHDRMYCQIIITIIIMIIIIIIIINIIVIIVITIIIIIILAGVLANDAGQWR